MIQSIVSILILYIYVQVFFSNLRAYALLEVFLNEYYYKEKKRRPFDVGIPTSKITLRLIDRFQIICKRKKTFSFFLHVNSIIFFGKAHMFYNNVTFLCFFLYTDFFLFTLLFCIVSSKWFYII